MNKIKLFHTDSSYYSMIARLTLEEKQVPWASHLLDIHVRKHQLKPEYALIHPGLLVPALKTDTETIAGSESVMRFVATHFKTGTSLIPESEADQHKMNAFIKRHYEIEIEDLTFGNLLAKNPVMNFMFPRIIEGIIKTCKATGTEHPELKAVYDQKIAQNRHRLEKFSKPKALYEKTKIQVYQTLDELESELKNGGPYICGENFSLADILWTVCLARLNWMAEVKKQRLNSPTLKKYWQTVTQRPAYKRADIWDKFDVKKAVLNKLTASSPF